MRRCWWFLLFLLPIGACSPAVLCRLHGNDPSVQIQHTDNLKQPWRAQHRCTDKAGKITNEQTLCRSAVDFTQYPDPNCK